MLTELTIIYPHQIPTVEGLSEHDIIVIIQDHDIKLVIGLAENGNV